MTDTGMNAETKAPERSTEPCASLLRLPLVEAVRELPLRATVAFAIRCAKRVEPLDRLWNLIPHAYAAGLHVPLDTLPYQGWMASHAANNAAHSAFSALETSVGNAHDAAVESALDALKAARWAANDSSLEAIAISDIQTISCLNLGRPSEAGLPLQWNDTRLGPLWPNGPPAWHIRAEEVCRELENDLQNLPDTNLSPLSPESIARLEDRAKLDQMWSDGKLERYRGQVLIYAEDTIFAHGQTLDAIVDEAEKKAQAKGVSPDRLVYYFVLR